MTPQTPIETCSPVQHKLGSAMILAESCPPATERPEQELALLASCLLMGALLLVVVAWLSPYAEERRP